MQTFTCRRTTLIMTKREQPSVLEFNNRPCLIFWSSLRKLKIWSPLEIEQSMRLCVFETVKSLQKRLWAIDFFGAASLKCRYRRSHWAEMGQFSVNCLRERTCLPSGRKLPTMKLLQLFPWICLMAVVQVRLFKQIADAALPKIALLSETLRFLHQMFVR